MSYENLSVKNPVAIMFNTKAVQNAPITSKDMGFVDVSELEEIYYNDSTDENWMKWFLASFKQTS